MTAQAQISELGRLPLGLERRRLFCHLTLAAEQLARESASGTDAMRFRRVAARLRDLVHGDVMNRSSGPLVPTLVGADVPLVVLLKRAWQDLGWPGSSHDVSPELLDASRQLLSELNWQLAD